MSKELVEAKRKYLMSKPALEQRREASKKAEGKQTGPKTREGKLASSKNNWKHGLYAKKFIFGNVGKICKVCCNLYPCEAIDSKISKPGGDCFIQKVHIVETFDAAMEGVVSGKYEDYNKISMLELAGLIEVFRSAKEEVLRDGVTTDYEIRDKEGNVVGSVKKEHPAMNTILKLADKLNFTPNDFVMTPAAIEGLNKGKKATEAVKSFAEAMSEAASRKIKV